MNYVFHLLLSLYKIIVKKYITGINKIICIFDKSYGQYGKKYIINIPIIPKAKFDKFGFKYFFMFNNGNNNNK